eukprot:NODE_1163_length_1443_cov_62.843465_g1152_i0.p1 GENE.NODE_1163_length_1443_cov_62.843465_g1152_i0~~NODE_1163_length_1443_cov_62.843465_g1152_i0.p1  ORF type:complete len:388 (-),score=18.28 NODE_1163_length_1443_cov_62.843465_g1152_i0:279-1382(-)
MGCCSSTSAPADPDELQTKGEKEVGGSTNEIMIDITDPYFRSPATTGEGSGRSPDSSGVTTSSNEVEPPKGKVFHGDCVAAAQLDPDGKFHLLHLLGAGSCGRVYLTEHRDGAQFALKLIRISAFAGNCQVTVWESVKREIRAARTMKHPNVMRYYSVARCGSNIGLYMEYCPGGSIRGELEKTGPFSNVEASRAMQDVLEGLAYLHSQGCIHRDLKCANLLRGSRGRLKITDFGCSAQLNPDHSGRYTAAGTLRWMAPEILASVRHSRPADIWSVGCLAIEMTTGKDPFDAVTGVGQLDCAWRELHKNPEVQLGHLTDPKAADFIRKCMSLTPSMRPSAHDLLSHPWITSPATKPEQIKWERKRPK